MQVQENTARHLMTCIKSLNFVIVFRLGMEARKLQGLTLATESL